MELALSLLIIAITCYVIALACDGFERATNYLGRNLKDGVKGATFNAIGSSMPELFAAFFSLLILPGGDGPAVGLGTTAGSAVFNGMIIPAMVIFSVLGFIFVKSNAPEIAIPKKVIWRDGIALICAELVLILLIGKTLSIYTGLVLMAIYLIYIFYMFTTMGTGEVEEYEDEIEYSSNNALSAFFKIDLSYFFQKELNTGSAWKLLIVATTVIAIAVYFLVEACVMFGHSTEINVFFVSVILAAAASSVPDTIISIKDAKNGNYADALSNALGSNIFDICFAFGLPLAIYCAFNGSIELDPATSQKIGELRTLLLLLTAVTVGIFLVGSRGSKEYSYMTRSKGFALMGVYAAFTAFVIARGVFEYPAAVEFGHFLSNLLPQT